ncbi:MAG TPA: acyltransferase [Polyangiaceae bacterium]|jgi:carbonic anhydrase/acetyltransferase-like protein (isoleucine patch superfamily)|nr:acyltransferase [Polyangiaceae bacterium]
MKRDSMMGAVADRWPRVGPRAERAIGYLVARHALRGCDVGAGVSVTGRLRVARRGGRIVVGRDALFVGGLEPTCLIAANATIAIGDATIINFAAHLAATGGDIVLGQRCHIGSKVRLLAEPGAPIFIGDDVWIARGAVVEAGVRIGPRSVIAAAAVVTRDVPPDSLAIGYPARTMSLDLAPGGLAAATAAVRASSFRAQSREGEPAGGERDAHDRSKTKALAADERKNP